jgi:3-methyladenine DNA glycosylase/8-oxoguanine DNA glycosylase
VHIRHHGAAIDVSAWGAGAEWALDAVPALLGLDDDPGGFEPDHPVLADLHRRFPGLRIGRSGAVTEALVPSILEQKVTSAEAHRSYARLVRRWGEPAPGPGGLMLPPAPVALAAAPYWAFHPVGVERRRADTLRRACAFADRLERAASNPEKMLSVLRSIPGIGPWTAAEVAAVALGDRDAVSVGDYHLPHVVAWALAGERRADDARMLELLEPYQGHRLRAVRLIEAAGIAPPRRAPRAPIRSIAAI